LHATQYPLIPHPGTTNTAAARIEAAAEFTEHGDLRLTYSLTARLGDLRIPTVTDAGRADGLWRHTCFEAFLRGDDAPAYREMNFSPSGRWQAYGFTGYRNGGLLESAPAPSLTRNESPDRLTLTCRLSPPLLPQGRKLELALTAVIEAADGTLSYWSLNHAPGAPDFHHEDGFVIGLQRP
jgi:hypothetical protein